MNPHQPTVLLGLAIAAGSFFLVWQVDTTLPHVDPPGQPQKARIQKQDLDVPGIAEFEDYYGRKEADERWRDLNPFIPWADRLAQRTRLQREGMVAEVQPQELPPPPKKKKEPKIVIPQRVLPEIDAVADGTPRVAGVVDSALVFTLWVRFGQAGTPVPMSLGDEHNGWRLDDVVDGQAIFINGDEVVLPVPLGVTGQMYLQQADAGSGGTPTPVDEVVPGGTDQAGLGQMVIKRMEATPEGRRALENIPGLRERILANPNQALQFLQRQNRERREP